MQPGEFHNSPIFVFEGRLYELNRQLNRQKRPSIQKIKTVRFGYLDDK